MAGELRNFDPDKVNVTWAIPTGAIDLTQGLIEGAGAISESKDNPRWTRRSDRQGNYVRNRKRQRGGTLTLIYTAEAQKQDELTGLMILDDQTEAIVGDILVKDLNGTTIAAYIGAFIEDDPALSYGDTAGDRAFVFGFAERRANLGGAETAV